MEIAEIIGEFESSTDTFARKAAIAAVERRGEIVPELLRVLEKNLAEVEETGKCASNAHLYAMLLLAQFRETRAYPLVLRVARLPSDPLEYMCGDFVTGNLASVLASVCGGDVAGIQSLIEDEGLDEWSRAAGLDALVILVVSGDLSRDELVSYFATLFRGKLKRVHSFIWENLVSCSTDMYPEELMPEITQAYADKLIDPRFMSLQDVERDLAMGKDRALARLAADPNRQFVLDTVKEMAGWAWEGQPARYYPPPPPPLKNLLEQPVSLTPIWKASPPAEKENFNAGRNDPCPCGSGKKYKKCCLQ